MSQEIDSSILITMIWLGYLYWHAWSARHLPPPGQDTAEHKQARLSPATSEPVRGIIDAVPPSGYRAAGLAGRKPALADALLLVEQHDRAFAPASFLEGAGRAYEDITIAFTAGDRELLHNLVSPDVYEGFDAAIADREQRGERAQASFVQVAPPAIIDAELCDGQTLISVWFAGELLTVVRTPCGDQCRSTATVDVWTFAKPSLSRAADWKLVASNPV